MLDTLKNLFKGTDFKSLISDGAEIIDVRTPGEFSMGHIKGSKNIPLDQIPSQSDKIKKMNKTIILCCASGMRSGQAAGILKQAGVDAHNGGGWSSLNSKI